MNYFHAIPEGQAIICQRPHGLYRQVELYQREDKIYAKVGAGYYRLHKGGGTSNPKINWYEIDTPEGSWSEVACAVMYQAGPSA